MALIMDADWLEEVLLATDRLFESTLGPEISEDAKDLCPVFFGQNSTAGEVSFQIATSLGYPDAGRFAAGLDRVPPGRP